MHTVLIIDDDPDYREFMGQLLKQRGWRVFEAENGDAGIKLANVHRPDVVLSDLLMASGNGFQVCRELRGNEDLRHTKIVVVSGRHFEKDRQAAFNAGADEYVTKPIDPDRFVLLLSRIAARAGGVEERPGVEFEKLPVRQTGHYYHLRLNCGRLHGNSAAWEGRTQDRAGKVFLYFSSFSFKNGPKRATITIRTSHMGP